MLLGYNFEEWACICARYKSKPENMNDFIELRFRCKKDKFEPTDKPLIESSYDVPRDYDAAMKMYSIEQGLIEAQRL